MASEWCDRMESAAEGHTENVCDGRTTVRVTFAEYGRPETWVAYVCDSCAENIRQNGYVRVIGMLPVA